MKTKYLILTLVATMAVSSFSVPAKAQSPFNLAKVIPAPAPSIPVMHIETIALNTVTSGPTFTYHLQVSPLTAMGCIVHLASSQVGGDVFGAFPLDSTASIIFTIPSYPVTAADIVTVVYWANK